MTIESLEALFERGLEYAYDCEQQLIKALPKMAEASSSAQLQTAFEQHLQETKTHAERLEQVFTSLGRKADTQTNDVVKALTSEGERMIKSIDSGPLRDAALIIAGNQVEHYEMAVYGSLRALANVLGHNRVAGVLAQTLSEEKAADEKLTEIGESSVNEQALTAGAKA